MSRGIGQRIFEGDPASSGGPDAWRHIAYRDLASWRGAYGWDKNSVTADAQIDFDPETLTLTMAIGKPLPRVRAVDGIESDMLGKVTGPTRVAGPLANPQARHVWTMDPRMPA